MSGSAWPLPGVTSCALPTSSPDFPSISRFSRSYGDGYSANCGCAGTDVGLGRVCLTVAGIRGVLCACAMDGDERISSLSDVDSCSGLPGDVIVSSSSVGLV